MTPLATLRSIPAPDALAGWLLDRYALQQPVTCTLVKWNWNDTYQVTTADGRLILRVYGSDRHDRAAIEYELALLAHLRRSGVGACCAVAARDGGELLGVPLAEGLRHAVLFEHAPGKLRSPTRPDLAAKLGEALARLHAAADSFEPGGSRAAQDIAAMLEQTPERLEELGGIRAADVDFVRSIAARLRPALEAAPLDRLDFGPIHGDPFSNNASIDDDGAVRWFDFDECRPGYRASDLTVPYWIGRGGQPEVWERFLEGYRAARPLADADVEVVPLLFIAQLLHTLTELPARRAPIHGSEIVRPLVAARLNQLRGVAGWLAS